MGPLGRVALSLAAGVTLIVLGVRLLFKRYHLLGQGLAGAGFVMLYFAFYAASVLYHLMPLSAAFGLMACVTAAPDFRGALPVARHRPARRGRRLRHAADDAAWRTAFTPALALGVGVLGIRGAAGRC